MGAGAGGGGNAGRVGTIVEEDTWDGAAWMGGAYIIEVAEGGGAADDVRKWAEDGDGRS